jgi:WD40 repeat protein
MMDANSSSHGACGSGAGVVANPSDSDVRAIPEPAPPSSGGLVLVDNRRCNGCYELRDAIAQDVLWSCNTGCADYPYYFPETNKVVCVGTEATEGEIRQPGDDRRIQVQDLNLGTTKMLESSKDPVILALSHGGGKIITNTLSYHRKLTSWDPETGAILFRKTDRSYRISHACFTMDDSKLIFWEDDYAVHVWDAVSGDELSIVYFDYYEETPTDIIPSLTSQLFVVQFAHHFVVYDLQGKVLFSQLMTAVQRTAFGLQDAYVVAAGGPETSVSLRGFELCSGNELFSVSIENILSVYHMVCSRMSPTVLLMVVVEGDVIVIEYDCRTGAELRRSEKLHECTRPRIHAPPPCAILL